MRMSEGRTLAATSDTFDTLLSDPVVPVQVTRPVRNMAGGFTFDTSMNVLNIDGDTRQVTVAVTWQWKGEPHNHTITSIVRRPS
jgi:hypothetical protein